MSILCSWRRSALVLLSIGALVPGASRAQVRPDSQRVDTTNRNRPAAPGSPRTAVRRFLELTRAGDYASAGRFLEPPGVDVGADSAELARRLKIVLDRRLWIDLDQVSGLAVGDTTDGLGAGLDQVGTIRGRFGEEPVRLRRVVPPPVDGDVYWRFSSGTVERIPAWFEALPNHWLIERLPPSLLRPGPFEIVWWQWLALLIFVPVALALGWAASSAVRRLLRSAVARTETRFDDMLLEELGGPATAAMSILAMALMLPLIGLNQPAADVAERLLRAVLLLVLFWAVWRLVDIARHLAERTTWARTVHSSRALLPLGARTVKVLVIALAFVAALSLLGYPVTSLVAGLGLGGLALALAAQKTVENLFGAFSIGIDQPFREGDFVKIEDFVGTVEAIGLRSTRFRTLDRTLITIPNGRLAEMRLESFTARDRFRLAFTLGLVYETTPAQMRVVLEEIERVLRAHPQIWPDAVVVRFAAFGESSLNIEIMAWFLAADWGEFQRIRQEILLQFMDVVARAGTAIARPTRVVHMAPSASSAA